MEELFDYIFGIYIKFGCKNPSILTPSDSVDITSKAETNDCRKLLVPL